ncbi:cysteine--tRNA ligase [Nitratireductor sp. StC3]|uniref:cysteine--tRNA ligase n=1 Tax=Nitratireductor sp. StC3 TaxID=2126741 RepID=UPI000D0D1A78|nr:cysteine--tRNA ligase [Nitratireductor sp. StC3]PSM17145.1 cysteine--tRNA ligase [Nitratireductor sp. StC3]
MSEAFRGLRLYNTLSREKEDFIPLDPDNVRLYVCGPTVYDFAHIGNARPVIVFDVLYRLLRHLYGADHVTYVRNITDVDDKINARALRDFGAEIGAGRLSLNQAIGKVTQKTADQFHEDVKALGCLEPDFEPRATEFVLPRDDGKTDMVGLIQTLIERGHAYAAKGEILFDTASMPDYGRLSRRRLEDQQAGARVAVEAHKKTPADFVLWKQSSSDEPGWDATFVIDGARTTIRGRPGWHIECSAMSAAYLGEVFDIHGGGLDLIFPHHENEIAQSRCAHGTQAMARYWMHNGFLQVEGRKMSKSEGNFVTIHDLLHTEKFGGRKWPGAVLRLAMLMTHYREPIDFSVRKLEEAEVVLMKWNTWTEGVDRAQLHRSYDQTEPLLSNYVEGIVRLLSDDLNMPAVISDMHSNISMGQGLTGGGPNSLAASLILLGFESLVGARWPAYEMRLELGELKAAVERRLAFIRDKNWAEADRIREELAAQGIQLKDGKDPETGERVTTWEVKR